MDAKHYKTDTVLKFRKIDISLTQAVILGLGEISGNDIELLGGLYDVFASDAPDEPFDAVQRTHPDFTREVELKITVSQAQFMLNLLYGQVKAFTAKDIQHVREIRKRLTDALVAAEITSTGVDAENQDDSSSKE